MSPEETEAQEVIMGEAEKSVELLIEFDARFENRTQDSTFNLLDNDYIELVTSYWDIKKNLEEDKKWLYLRQGPKLIPCGLQKEL